MSKIKEHYHDEISSGMHGDDQKYAIDTMKAIAKSAEQWLDSGDTDTFIRSVLKEIKNFEYMTPPQKT